MGRFTHGWIGGWIHTAVEGVYPGESGQATGAEGLHPPLLSLPFPSFARSSLSFSLLLCLSVSVLLFLSLLLSLLCVASSSLYP